MDSGLASGKPGWKSLYQRITSRPIVICRPGQCGCSAGEIARCLALPSPTSGKNDHLYVHDKLGAIEGNGEGDAGDRDRRGAHLEEIYMKYFKEA